MYSEKPYFKIALGGVKQRIPTDQIIKKAQRLKVEIIDVHYSITTRELVEKAHTSGLEVHVWTVDEEVLIKKMKVFGVDGITSNWPDKI